MLIEIVTGLLPLRNNKKLKPCANGTLTVKLEPVNLFYSLEIFVATIF